MKDRDFVLAEPVTGNEICFTKLEDNYRFTVRYDELANQTVKPTIECHANGSERGNKSEPINYSFQGLGYFIEYKLDYMMQKQRSILDNLGSLNRKKL